MRTETILELLFAAGVVATAAAFATAALHRTSRAPFLGLAAGVGAAATGAWVAYALNPARERALSAAGLTVCFVAVLGAYGAARAVARARRIDEHLATAEQRLHALIEREAGDRAAELERTLARARADSVSLLNEQERQIADERRSAIAEREHSAGAHVSESMAAVERRVEQRLAEWSADLDRAQQSFAAQLKTVARRQAELMAETEARIEADAKELKTASEEQRTVTARLREELAHAARNAGASAREELESHEAERRRALHEVSERLRQRERDLRERIGAEEAEAIRRIQSAFADVERRQLDQLGRVVERTANSLSEQAVAQFADAVKVARDDAAKRLSRELDRAVAMVAREAQTVLAERIAQVSDAGAQRVERRLSQITAALDRQRDEFLAQFEHRFADTEADLRAQIQAIGADADAERTVLEARLHALAQRISEAAARGEERLPAGSRRE